MKTFKKISFITALCLLLSGLTLAGLGYVRGGWSDLSSYTNPSKNNHYQTKKVADFDHLLLNCNVSDIIIKTGNQEKPSITYYVDKKYPIKIEQTGKSLSISEKSKVFQNKPIINFLTLRNLTNIGKNSYFGIKTDYSIQITLPKGHKLSSLKGNLKIGELKIENSQIQMIDFLLSSGNFSVGSSKIMNGQVTLHTGDMTFTDSHVSNSKINVDAGNIDFETSSIANSQLTLKAGDFTATDVGFSNKNSLRLDMGNADIHLKNHDLALKTNKNSGNSDITANLKENSQNQLEVTNKLGDITVE
ncbi:signal peptide [Streptococcus porcinus]|uniref:DUF4097 family beta strand repeat-containing protein n=1 Tax=Streptococcus porcinus TaxID=1340 RepID=UPI0010CAC989|nr:DUF4097 family beta strand repeat-containing protein [Streptococcus porcinus]VTS47416.1 signal peptide [Streptococcus porcinus]